MISSAWLSGSSVVTTPAIDPETMQKKIRETPSDPSHPDHDRCDPYRILHYFHSLCDPKQERLFCRYQTIPQAAHRRKPENIHLARLRTNPVTVPEEARLQHQSHKNDKSGKPYYRSSDVAEKLLQDAISNKPPSNHPPPPDHPQQSPQQKNTNMEQPHPTILFLRNQLEKTKKENIALQCELAENRNAGDR